MRALRKHRRDSEQSPFVFVSERGAPLTAPASRAWSSGRPSPPNSASRRTLYAPSRPRLQTRECRHRYRLLQAYLGRRNIQSTTRLHRTGARSVQRFLEGLGSDDSGRPAVSREVGDIPPVVRYERGEKRPGDLRPRFPIGRAPYKQPHAYYKSVKWLPRFVSCRGGVKSGCPHCPPRAGAAGADYPAHSG